MSVLTRHGKSFQCGRDWLPYNAIPTPEAEQVQGKLSSTSSPGLGWQVERVLAWSRLGLQGSVQAEVTSGQQLQHGWGQCGTVNTGERWSRAVWPAVTPLQHWSARTHRYGWGRACSAGTLLLLLHGPAVIPEGMGTIRAKRRRHRCHCPMQLWQRWHPSSSCFSPLLQVLNLSVCLQRKSLSPKQDFLSHELILFFPSRIPSLATV